MKKKLVSLLLVVVMVLSLVACGKDADTSSNSGKTNNNGGNTGKTTDDNGKFVLNVCIASEPETIDPSLISSVDASTYTQHQFEGLMKYAPTTEYADESGQMFGSEVICGQAKSYDVSEDMCEYVFHLRDDIYWSDGVEVTAKDFVYSWRRIVDPATASDYGYILDNIVLNAAAIQAGEKSKEELGIEAIDDKTLKITLEAPCAYFISLCGFASLMPLREDVVEGNENWTDPSSIVVNGPYIIKEWVHDSYILMEKNEKYYDLEKLGPDQIKWGLSDSETAIISAYQSGEYDFIESFPSDMIEDLKASGDCFTDPYIGTYFLYLNCKEIPDWRVRAAMAISVDRENIVNNVTQGGQTPATGLVAKGILDSTGKDFSEGVSELGALYATLQKNYPQYDLSTYAGRCDLAKALYKEAVDDGSWDPNTTVVYNFNTSEAHKAVAEACGSDWQTVLGLNITLQNQEWNTYTNGLGEHKFGVARLGWIADYNDALTYLELFMTGNSYNYGLYSDSKYDSLCAQAKASAAGSDRDALLYAAEEAMFGEGGFPVCPIYYYTRSYCIADGINNVFQTSLGYYFFMFAKLGN